MRMASLPHTRSAHVVEVLADAISAPVSDADAAINHILAGMGALSGVDRAYVFQRKPGDLLDNTHEWCGPGLAPMIDMLQDMSMAIIAPWRAGFELGQPLHVASVKSVGFDPYIRDLLAMQGILGLLLVPLQFDGKIVGFVGFDRVTAARPFSPGVLRILTSIAGAVGTILARAAADREILRTKSELEVAVQQLRHLAMHDDLTTAPNRRAFHLAVVEELAARDVDTSQTCVAIVDLMGFKSVNETHGHTEGDALLRQIVARWQKATAQTAGLFRIGGDEFAIVLRGPNAEEKMTEVIADMRMGLVAPFVLGGHHTRVAISAGLAMAPRDGTTVDALAANAGLALLASKTEKGRTCVYRPQLRQQSLQRHETVQDLLAANLDQDFPIVYQPIVDLRSGAIVKLEILLRWQHPTRGLLLPADFIDALCSLPLSRTLGRQILEIACRQVADWNSRFDQNLVVSVNAFPLQLATFDFVDDIHTALRHSDLPVANLEIEVTENIVMQEGSLNRKVLQRLSDLSVSIALDDFGTGFASMNSLTQIDLQTLKIDGSFVKGLSQNDRRIEVLKAMQHMAKGLGLTTIVEGIEDAEVASIIRAIGFGCGQGYYWSRPIDAQSCADLLRRQSMRSSLRA
jgi:diguanylate cyclase (GGDEF)-like protein